MKSLIEYFDRAYIINLPDRADRRRSVTREFAAIGLHIPNDKVRFYSAIRPTEQDDFYSLGARGSFSSHRNVLKLAAADRLKNILVFEDDVALRKIPEPVIGTFVAHLRETAWDVAYFGYLEPTATKLEGPLAPWPHDTLGGHFYGVNGSFMKRMAQYMDECEARPRNHPLGGPMSRDGAYNHIRYVYPDIRVLIAIPNLAHQISSKTDIAPNKFYDDIAWLQPPIQVLRSIKTRARMLVDRLATPSQTR